MRRSTRTTASSVYPPPFQQYVDKLDVYARSANLKPLVIPFPLPETELEGVRLRLRRNSSFVRTDSNPDPPALPEGFQKVDLADSETRIDNLLNSLRIASPPGIMVLLVQPPAGRDFRLFDASDDEKWELQQSARPVCGVLVRIGPSKPADDEDDKDELTLERSIIGCFCRRTVPCAASEELLLVALIRAVIEAICYEEVALREARIRRHEDPSPDRTSEGAVAIKREKRFMAMNASELPLCPVIALKCLIEDLKFAIHWDSEYNAKPFAHEEASRKDCPCIKKFRREFGELDPEDEYYQFFTLNCKRIKGLFDSVIPAEPSPAVLDYCLEKDSTRKRGCGSEDAPTGKRRAVLRGAQSLTVE